MILARFFSERVPTTYALGQSGNLQQQTCFENYITYYSSMIKMYSNIFTEAHRLYIVLSQLE